MNEVRVRVFEEAGTKVAFVDLVDRENKAYKTLNNFGEWQEASLYTVSPPETKLKVVMS